MLLGAQGVALDPLEDPHVRHVTRRYPNVTVSQVLHRWAVQRWGAAVIPRSTKRRRVRENLGSLDPTTS